MGGKAFNQLLPPTAFPRIPSAVYHAVKARLLPRLQNLFEHVGVPCEAPEKVDHGDLDFIVATAKAEGLQTILDRVKAALGATVSIHIDGNPTTNFATPAAVGEWAAYGHAAEEEKYRGANGDSIYYQVDIHVCTDLAEWNRVIFFHSYGDLGMILGLVARNNGFLLGVKGLKIPDQPNPPFELSTAFSVILPFFQLSLDTWEKGFKTKLQVFEWVASSRFFDHRNFKTKGEGIKKVKQDRTMYAEFVEWVEDQRGRWEADGVVEDGTARKERAEVIEEALVYFNKKEEFEELAHSRLNRARMKEGFNGHKVNEWAGMASNWMEVKRIMDGVRMKIGGDEGIANFLKDSGEEELKKVVLEVKDELTLGTRAEELVGRMAGMELIQGRE